VTPSISFRPQPAAVLGCLALLTIGWTGLLIPSLIRSIKDAFDQSDAGIGLIYLIYAVAYAAGSFGGGPATERFGRRTVLTGAALIHGAGIVGLGLAPSWAVFAVLAVPAGLGAGGLDGGSNGLFLDLFRSNRGRAMNLLHLFFSIGALSAPLIVGALVDSGIAWQVVIAATGIAPLALAAGFCIAALPSGRTTGGRVSTSDPADAADAAAGGAGSRAGLRRRIALPLVLLGIGILTYVASEVGVSNWLVRFLDRAPLGTATLALSLFWAGLAVGRLVSSGIADRFDHVRFTAACAGILSVALVGAVAVPSLALSIGLFTIVGIASGPIFPMILAVGGERYAERSAAVSGLLTGFGVVGGVLYPPLMGVLSVTVGLTAAMYGTAILGLVCAAALIAFDRRSRVVAFAR
jgi:MFS transporter, FHS family, glucose/mannose:H+ symporter